MLRTILIVLALATPAFAQQELPLPRVYTVTHVAPNDTLNIREAPSRNARDIGDLLPNQTIEVLELSEDGKWGLVSTSESIGWVSTRYLVATPKTIGLSDDIPFGMPGQLSCSGTEPFWSAEILTGTSFSFAGFNSDDYSLVAYPMLGATKPINRGIEDYGFISPPFTGVLSRGICDDGMSESLYGWSLILLRMYQGGASMISGCCSATQP